MADIEKMAKDKLGPLVARSALGFVVVYHAYLRITHGGGATWHHSMTPTIQILYAWAELFAGLFVILGVHCRIACGIILGLVAFSVWNDYSLGQLNLSLARMEGPWLFHALLLAVMMIGPGEWALTIGFAKGKSRSKASPPPAIRAA